MDCRRLSWFKLAVLMFASASASVCSLLLLMRGIEDSQHFMAGICFYEVAGIGTLIIEWAVWLVLCPRDFAFERIFVS